MSYRLLYFLLFIFSLSFAQQNEKTDFSYIQVEYFSGNILRHNKNVGHFLLGHPNGFILSWNKKSTGKEAWEHRYNYPDFGFSMAYQDYKNPILGKLYSIYGHYNFYLLPRRNKNQLVLRAGWGLAYNTNPYDKVNNPKNLAFGTRLNSSTYFKLYYQREHLIDRIGLNAGLTFIHASNSSIKSPNTGVNVWAATIGLNYNLNDNKNIEFVASEEEKTYKEPIKFNFVLRGGINESDFIGSGVKPFFVLSAYVDKRLNRKSAIQFGGDYYVSYMLKDFIKISHIANSDFKEGDFKRAGIFIGHEFFLNKVSVISQLGYYVYYPFEFEGRVYERLGLKRYFKDKWFASISLKAHAAKAETVAFGIGIRL
jgi:hypothetical protein